MFRRNSTEPERTKQILRRPVLTIPVSSLERSEVVASDLHADERENTRLSVSVSAAIFLVPFAEVYKSDDILKIA
jgi:hypothetical protein